MGWGVGWGGGWLVGWKSPRGGGAGRWLIFLFRPHTLTFIFVYSFMDYLHIVLP